MPTKQETTQTEIRSITRAYEAGGRTVIAVIVERTEERNETEVELPTTREAMPNGCTKITESWTRDYEWRNVYVIAYFDAQGNLVLEERNGLFWHKVTGEIETQVYFECPDVIPIPDNYCQLLMDGKEVFAASVNQATVIYGGEVSFGTPLARYGEVEVDVSSAYETALRERTEEGEELARELAVRSALRGGGVRRLAEALGVPGRVLAEWRQTILSEASRALNEVVSRERQ